MDPSLIVNIQVALKAWKAPRARKNTIAHHYEKTIKGVENNHIYKKRKSFMHAHIYST